MQLKLTSRKADIILALVAMMWGHSFIPLKALSQMYPPAQVLFMRAVVSAFFAVIVFRKHVFKATRKEVLAGAIMGVCLAGASFVQAMGVNMTTAGKCAFLTSTNVVLVPFVAWLLVRQRPGKKELLNALLMFVGVCLLTVNFSDLTGFAIGDLVTFSGAFLYALHIVVTGIFAKDSDTYAVAAFQFVFMAVTGLVLLAATPEKGPITVEGVGLSAYLGFGPIFIGHSMQTICQKYTSSTKAALILSLEGVFGSLFGVLLLGETYGPVAIISFALILASVIMAQVDIKLPHRHAVRAVVSNK